MPSAQGKAHKGSQKWLQIAVNECSGLLSDAITSRLPNSPTEIEWLSPLENQNYKEQRDKEFLDNLGKSRFLQKPLPSWPELYKFWPRNGPRWDAHGTTDKGQILLVEAKSHIAEMRGSGSGAKSQKSIEKMAGSLREMQGFIETCRSVNWFSSPYFQYTNRLAHLYWFREINGLPAFLIMFYFLNDVEQRGPSDPAEWQSAIREAEHHLGLPETHALSDFIVSVFVDINDINQFVGRK
jgi:hypothetical protein